MILYILEYTRTAYTIHFNPIEENKKHYELYTKRSELFRRIEEIEELDTVYIEYKQVKVHTVNLDDLKTPAVNVL